MDILINLFAPCPAHEDFKRLKAAYKRKEKIIEKLKKKNNKTEKPKLTYDNLYNDNSKITLLQGVTKTYCRCKAIQKHLKSKQDIAEQ